jgi:hypothetical protein
MPVSVFTVNKELSLPTTRAPTSARTDEPGWWPMGRESPLAEKLLADEGRLEVVGEELVDASAPARSGRFGGKGFGLLPSIALTTNNISGAGMLEFPQMFQRAGLLPSFLSLGLVSRQAYLSSRSDRHR